MTVTGDRSVIHATPVYTNIYQSLALYIYQGTHGTGKIGKMAKKIPCQ